MRRLGLLCGAVSLLALAIAGCGGGDGEDSTAAAPVETTEAAALSKEELLAQGDAVCAEVNAAVGAAGSTSAGAGEAVVQAANLYDGMVERLKDLGAPSDETAGHAEFISSAEALAQAEENVKLAYEREEPEALESASTSVASALSEFQSAAREFGFERCAETPTAPSPGSTGSAGESGGEEAAEGVEEESEEVAPEEEAEAAPEAGGAGAVEEESAGGGAGVGGGTEGGGGSGGGSSGGIGPG
jgi:hypothetical protein